MERLRLGVGRGAEVVPQAPAERVEGDERLGAVAARGEGLHQQARAALVPLVDWASTDDHYARLYRSIVPLGMSVQEHTAQWTSAEASRIQDDFMRGAVNVLSCSTTFEFGVDVGEVEAVLLRNVPPGRPTTSNARGAPVAALTLRRSPSPSRSGAATT